MKVIPTAAPTDLGDSVRGDNADRVHLRTPRNPAPLEGQNPSRKGGARQAELQLQPLAENQTVQVQVIPANIGVDGVHADAQPTATDDADDGPAVTVLSRLHHNE